MSQVENDLIQELDSSYDDELFVDDFDIEAILRLFQESPCLFDDPLTSSSLSSTNDKKFDIIPISMTNSCSLHDLEMRQQSLHDGVTKYVSYLFNAPRIPLPPELRCEDVFNNDGKRGRYEIISTYKKVFKYVMPMTYYSQGTRFRETLNENIQEVFDAILYFWNFNEKKEINSMLFKESVQRLFDKGSVRPLWSIVELKTLYLQAQYSYRSRLLHQQLENISQQIGSLLEYQSSDTKRGIKRYHDEVSLEDDVIRAQLRELQNEAEVALHLSQLICHGANSECISLNFDV